MFVEVQSQITEAPTISTVGHQVQAIHRLIKWVPWTKSLALLYFFTTWSLATNFQTRHGFKTHMSLIQNSTHLTINHWTKGPVFIHQSSTVSSSPFDLLATIMWPYHMINWNDLILLRGPVLVHRIAYVLRLMRPKCKSFSEAEA